MRGSKCSAEGIRQPAFYRPSVLLCVSLSLSLPLSLSLSLSHSLREVSVVVVRAFPDLAQGLKTLKKVVGKKRAQEEETQIQGRREQGRVRKR